MRRNTRIVSVPLHVIASCHQFFLHNFFISHACFSLADNRLAPASTGRTSGRPRRRPSCASKSTASTSCSSTGRTGALLRRAPDATAPNQTLPCRSPRTPNGLSASSRGFPPLRPLRWNLMNRTTMQINQPRRYVPMFGDVAFDSEMDFGDFEPAGDQLDELGKLVQEGKARLEGKDRRCSLPPVLHRDAGPGDCCSVKLLLRRRGSMRCAGEARRPEQRDPLGPHGARSKPPLRTRTAAPRGAAPPS